MSERDHFDVEGQLPAMRRYARTLTRDEHSADDLVQDALLRAYTHASTFEKGRSLKTWLLAIVHNQFVSGVRRRLAEQRRDAVLITHDAVRSVAADQEHAVYLRQIGELFDALPEPQRVVLHLIAVEGLSYREAADTLGIAIGTVMSRLHRARSALRDADQDDRGGATLRIVGGRDVG